MVSRLSAATYAQASAQILRAIKQGKERRLAAGTSFTGTFKGPLHSDGEHRYPHTCQGCLDQNPTCYACHPLPFLDRMYVGTRAVGSGA
eukprot:2633157-Rhodomonas_salina.1